MPNPRKIGDNSRMRMQSVVICCAASVASGATTICTSSGAAIQVSAEKMMTVTPEMLRTTEASRQATSSSPSPR
jgi:hypothetical protein